MIGLDAYSKAVLTVIAFSLLWLCITLNTKPVQAQGSTRVVISGIDLPDGKGGVLPVGIYATGFVGSASYGNWTTEPVPVKVSNKISIKKER